MTCTLTPQQYEEFFSFVVAHLYDHISQKTPYNFQNHAKHIYNLVYDKSKDHALAMTYVSLLPQNIRIAQRDEDIADLTASSYPEVIRQGKLFKDLDNVEKFLGILPTSQEVINQAVAEDKKVSEIPAPVDTPKKKDMPFKGMPVTAMATIGQEAYFLDFKEKEVDRSKENLPDPAKAYHARIIRDLLNLHKEGNVPFSELNYKGRYGFFLRPMSLDQIPDDSLYPEVIKARQDYAKGNTRMSNLLHDVYGDSKIVMVLTDAYGHPYQFDDNGDITYSDKGKYVYQFMRVPKKTEKGKFVQDYGKVQSAEDILNREERERKLTQGTNYVELTAEQRQQRLDKLKEGRQAQFKQIYEIAQYIKNHPEERMTLEIQDGSLGYFGQEETDVRTGQPMYRNPLAKANVSLDEIKNIRIIKSQGDKASYSYIQIGNIPNLIQVDRAVFPREIATKIADMLTKNLMVDGFEMDDKQKADYIKQFLVPNNKDRDSITYDPNTKDSIVLHIGRKEFKFDSTQDQEAIITELTNPKKRLSLNDALLLQGNYVDYTMKDNTAVKEEKNYYQFVKDHQFIYAQLDSTGNVALLNPYLTYSIPQRALDQMKAPIQEEQKKEAVSEKYPVPGETKQKIEEVKEIKQSEKKEDLLKKTFKKKDTNFDPDLLKKIKAVNNSATQAQVDTAKAWYDSHPIRNHIPYQTLFNIVNSDAFASWNLNGINLYAGSNFTDLYHEAWHGFTQLYLTKGQKAELYDEVRKKVKGGFTNHNGAYVEFSKATDLDIEEYLAEDFRKYSMGGAKPKVGLVKRNTIFRKILDFLNWLFTGYTRTEVITQPMELTRVKEMYDNLFFGEINQYKYAVDNSDYTQLDKGIKSISTEAADERSLEDSKLISDTLDSLFSDIINDQNTKNDTNAYTGSVFLNTQLLSNLYNEAYNRIVDLYDQFTEKAQKAEEEGNDELYQTYVQNANLLAFTVENYGDVKSVLNGKQEDGVIAYHYKKSKYLATSFQYLSTDEDKTSDEQDVAESYGDRLGNDRSIKELAASEILWLVKSLHKMKDGKFVRNKLGVKELVDFDMTWNSLVRAVSDAYNKPDMYNKLVEKTALNPEFDQLVQKLGKPYELSYDDTASDINPSYAFDMWTRFFRDLRKAETNLIQLTIFKDTKREGEVITNQYATRAGESSSDTNSTRRDFISRFKSSTPSTNPYVVLDDNRNVKLNVSKVVATFGRGNVPVGKEYDFLRAIGFFLDEDPSGYLQKQLKTQRGTLGIDQIYQSLKVANEWNRKTGGLTITNPIEWLSSRHPEIVVNTGGIVYDLKDDNAGRVKKILEFHTKNSSTAGFSVLTAESTVKYKHRQYCTISQLVASINHAANYQELITMPETKHFDIRVNPFVKHSVLFNSVFILDESRADYGQKRKVSNEPGAAVVKINVDDFSGAQIVANAGAYALTGVNTANADRTTKFLTEFHTMLMNGWMEITRHGSKSTTLAMTADKLFTYAGKQNPFLYVDSSEFYSRTATPDQYLGWSSAFKVISGYMNAELERIVKVKTNREAYAKAKGYNRVVNKEGELAGEVFTIFDDVFTVDTKKDLYNLVWDSKAKKSKGDFLTLIQKPENRPLLESVQQEFKTYFDQVVDRHQNVLNENKFVSSELRAAFINSFKAGDKVVLESDRVEKALVRSFVFNSWMQYAENSFVLYGDLAQYNHAKRDFHKRNSAFSSTGDIPVTDQGSVDYAKIRLGRGYAQALKAAGLLSGEIKAFNGTFDTAILKDLNTPSAYLSVYEKAAREELMRMFGKKYSGAELNILVDSKLKSMLAPYSKMTEGDGQGWISIDSYRIFMTLIGQWGPRQESLYKRVIKGEKITTSDSLTFFQPIKVQYAGPLQNSVEAMGLPITALHKFSLFPLTPGVIAGTNLDNLHKKMINEGVDYALFESGSKIGGITSDGEYDPYYTVDKNGNRQENETLPFTKNTIHLNYLKNQQNIANEFKGKSTFSTQLRGLILDGLEEQGIPVDFMTNVPTNEKREQWEALTEEQKVAASPFYTLGKELKSNIDRLTELKKKELLREAGWKEDPKTGELTGNVADLLNDVIIPELEKRDISEHDLEYIEVDKTTGEIKYDLSLHYNADMIEKFLTSIINNRLVRQKATGESLVQVAASMFENIGFKEKFREATEAEKLKHVGTNDLPTYHPKVGVAGPKKVDVTITDGDKILSGKKTTLIGKATKLEKGESGLFEVSGKKFILTSRGDQDVYTAGGPLMIVESEGLPKNSTKTNKVPVLVNGIRYYAPSKEMADWLKGVEGNVQPVYDIKPYNEKDFASEGKSGDTAAAKVKIAIQGNFVNLLHHKDVQERHWQQNITQLEALNQLLKDEEWLNKDDNRKMITMVGVRIPVQGLNSMEFMEVYEFLPANAGNIIILPSEIVAKSGGDFDIDKLTVLMPSLYSDGSYATRSHETFEQVEDELDKARDEFKVDEVRVNETIDKLKAQRKAKQQLGKDLIKKLVQDRENAAFRRTDIIDSIREVIQTLKDTARMPAALKEADTAADDTLENILDSFSKKLPGIDEELDELYKDLKTVRSEMMANINNEMNRIREGSREDSEFIGRQIDEMYMTKREAKDNIRKLRERKKKFLNTVENDLINNIRSVLELPHNFVSLIRPNDTDIAKPISQELSQYTRQYKEKMRLMDKEGGSTVSPTRILENEFNLHIHEANRVGKDSLGIAAKENKYKSMFNDIGAYLKDHYVWEQTGKRKGVAARQERRVKILLPHNPYTYSEGNQKKTGVSLSNLYDATQIDKINDIISQIMNGLVDVEKDDWAADIQANKELTPMLLFLVTAGVPLRDAAFFVSQPLVMEYVRNMRLYKSTFAAPLGEELENANFYRVQAKNRIMQDIMANPEFQKSLEGLKTGLYTKFLKQHSEGASHPEDLLEAESRAREEVIANTGIGFENKQTGKFIVKPAGLYNFTTHYTDQVLGKEAKISDVEDVVKNQDKSSEKAIALFLHFLEIEEMMKGIAELKFKTNVDTKKDTSLFSSAMRNRDIQLLSQSTKIPTDLVRRFKEESVIGSFFIQDFTHRLFNKFYPFRTNTTLTDFMIYKMKQRSTADDIDETFGDDEKFVKGFHNDLVSFVFQNHIKGFNLSNSKTYKGYKMDTELPVKQADKLSFGAWVKDNQLYVDREQLKEDWNDKLYTYEASKEENSYTKRGLATLSPVQFVFNGIKSENEYYHFVVEREYLRSITKMEGDRKEYEIKLRDQALKNIFNLHYLFKDKDKNMGVQFIQLINKYPKLVDEYSLVNNLAVDQDPVSGMANLILRDKQIDSDKIDTYYQNFQELIDKTKQSAEVVDYFSKLPIYAYMQSGIAKTKYSITEVVSAEPFLKLMGEPTQRFMDKYLNTWRSITKQDLVKELGQESAAALTAKLDKDGSFVLWDDQYGAKKVDGKYLFNDNTWMLQLFYENFVRNNSYDMRATNSRYKDYLISRNTSETGRKVAARLRKDEVSVDIERKVPVFNLPVKDKKEDSKVYAQRVNKMIAERPDLVYAFDDSWKDAKEGVVRDGFDNMIRNNDNAFGIRSAIRTGGQWGIETAEHLEKAKGFVEQDLLPLIEARDAGKKILFSKGGFGTELKGNDKQMYEYISRRLYEEFGYVNPGFLSTPTGIKHVEAVQGITDEEVEEKIKSCFNL